MIRGRPDSSYSEAIRVIRAVRGSLLCCPGDLRVLCVRLYLAGGAG